MEALDASGKVVGKDHVEIITAGGWMTSTFVIATLVGLAIMAAAAGYVGATWLRVVLMILGAIVALIAVGSFVFVVWGKYVGMPWHFTA